MKFSKSLTAVALLSISGALSACDESGFSIDVRLADSKGAVTLKTTGDDPVILQAGKSASGSAAFYDSNGQAEMSIRFDGVIGPVIFDLGQSSKDMKTALETKTIRAVSAGQKVEISFLPGLVEPVHSEWDTRERCVLRTHEYCEEFDVREPGKPHRRERRCRIVEVYGQADFHHVTDGNVFHYDLTLTQGENSARMIGQERHTSTRDYQTSSCY